MMMRETSHQVDFFKSQKVVKPILTIRRIGNPSPKNGNHSFSNGLTQREA
jgi:hypothetical protein